MGLGRASSVAVHRGTKGENLEQPAAAAGAPTAAAHISGMVLRLGPRPCLCARPRPPCGVASGPLPCAEEPWGAGRAAGRVAGAERSSACADRRAAPCRARCAEPTRGERAAPPPLRACTSAERAAGRRDAGERRAPSRSGTGMSEPSQPTRGGGGVRRGAGAAPLRAPGSRTGLPRRLAAKRKRSRQDCCCAAHRRGVTGGGVERG